MRKLLFALFAAAAVGSALIAQGQTLRPSPDVYGQLRWRYIGPEGNRTDAVAGVPGDPLTFYAGAASGGVWKTSDGGIHWEPIFDAQDVSSIGSLAVAPSDPNIVWAGTGEPFIRSHISVGEGIFKSTDAGKTWTRTGLEKTGRIARVVVHPSDPNIVVACALGHAYGPQPERGVFRTTDGGRNWERVLFVDENTGCSDLAMDPKNPRILFAGMWQIEIHTWGRDSGGPGSGLFTSRDGGATWTRLTGHGLPAKPVGKVAVAIARSNPNRVYAMIETGDGVPLNGKDTDKGQIWRTEDGGANWRMVNTDRNAMGRAHYYSRMAVATDNENETYYLTASFSKSIDAGQTLTQPPGLESPGGDNHDMWIDPTDASRMAVANDAGVSISVNRGRTWNHVRLPIAQLYHVTVDNQIPYFVYGNKQDGPSYRGPSNSRTSEGGGRGGFGSAIPRSMWHTVGGGESGFATPDPVDANVVWSSASGSGSVGGIVTRYEENRRLLRDVEVWPEDANGPAAELKYRFVWNAPLAMSPHDRNKIYVGSQHVHQTTDGGQSWQEISPDLTLNDKSRQGSSGGLTPDNIGVEYAGVVMSIAESPKQAGVIWAGTNDGLVQVTRDGGQSWQEISPDLTLNDKSRQGSSGGLTPDNIGVEYAGVVMSIAESPKQAGVIWAGTNDGLVQVTRDGGKTWTNVTKNMPGLPPWGTFENVEPSHFDAGSAYVSADFHQVNNRDPFIYKTTDFGATWKKITNGIPASMLSYVHCVREDPVRRGLLYAGTENGAYISFDDGDNWQPLQMNLPHAPVYWLVVQEHFNDLVIATYGRGFWILDDVTPLRELTPQVLNADAHLFAPRPAYRFRAITSEAGGGEDPTVGQNPQYGADINYYLKSAVSGPATITVTDSRGQVVRTLNDVPKAAGLNRAYWDLRDTAPKRVAFRTPPQYAEEIPLGADGTREGQSEFAILQPPGTYTVKLTFAGRDYTQPLVVLKDPHSAGTEADIAAQQTTLREIRRDLESAIDSVNNTETIRGQIRNMKNLIQDTELRRAADELEQKLMTAEGALVELRSTGRGQDGVRWGAKLAQKFSYLAGGLQDGDFKPTSQQLAVQKELEDRLKASQGQLGDVLNRDLGAFNDMLKRANLPSIVQQPTRRPTSPQ